MALTATAQYTYSKSVDDAAAFSGAGLTTATTTTTGNSNGGSSISSGLSTPIAHRILIVLRSHRTGLTSEASADLPV